jgi:hypothetical protein
MGILLDRYLAAEVLARQDCLSVELLQKMDSDEEIVRKYLVKAWTKVLEKYARPGAWIPDANALREELLEMGVDAGVDALCSEHWWAFSWMLRERVEEKVRAELNRFDLEDFIEDVRVAQHDPGMLNHLKEKIRRYVIEGL